MNFLKSYQDQFVFLMLLMVMALVPSFAFAALPAAVGTTITAATADITEAAGLILGVVITIAAVFWVRRVLSR